MLNKEICWKCSSHAFKNVFPEKLVEWEFNRLWRSDFCLCPLVTWLYKKEIGYHPFHKHSTSISKAEEIKIENEYSVPKVSCLEPPSGCAFALEHILYADAHKDKKCNPS